MSSVTPFPVRPDRKAVTAFDRTELQRILDLYGRMVAAGHWRDYAMHFSSDRQISTETGKRMCQCLDHLRAFGI